MFRKRLILILMMLTMAVSVVPSLVYAEEVANTESTPILLRAKTVGSKKVKLTWNKTKHATKYVIYGNKCGKKVKKIATVKGKKNKYTVKKIKKAKLKAHRFYKFYVVAYKGKTNLGRSKTLHFITGNTYKKYGNVKKIVAKTKKLNLAVGQTGKVAAKVKIYKKKKHAPSTHGAKFRYISSNTKIAKVSKTGVVTGVSDGTAIIYIQDIAGKYCKIKVTVTGSGKKPTPSAEPTPTPTPPVENTANYTIEYYQQDLQGAYPAEPSSTETKTGIAGTTANPEAKEITGFTFDAENTESIKSGTIESDGSLKLKLYYERNKYTVSFGEQTNGGVIIVSPQNADQGNNQYYYGQTITLVASANAGYEFEKWQINEEDDTSDTRNNPTKEYTVGEGNVVYRAVWEALKYTVTFDVNGGKPLEGNQREKEVEFDSQYGDMPIPSSDGYKFDGWYDQQSGGEKISETDIVKVPNDDTLYAHWTANTDTKYTVQHFIQDLDDSSKYSLAQDGTDTLEGTTGEMITGTPRDIVGFTYSGSLSSATKTETISGDGSTIIKLYYTRNMYDFAISYEGDGTATLVTPYDDIANKKFYYGRTISFEAQPDVEYKFKIWKVNGADDNSVDKDNKTRTITMPAQNTEYKATFEAGTDTIYMVRHFIQELDNTFSLHDTTNHYGTTGETATVGSEDTTKVYAGFTYDDNITGTKKSGTIVGDGSLELKLYHKRNLHTLTLTSDETKGTINLITPYDEGEQYFYERYVNFVAEPKEGYSFDKWQVDDADDSSNYKSEPNRNIKMGDADVKYTALWKGNEYTVSFNSNGGTTTPSDKSVTFGNTYGTLPSVEKTGYTFAGWYTTLDGSTEITENSVVSTAGNHTLFAHWTPNTDTEYKVEHYLQNPDGEGFAINSSATQTKTGTTGAEVNATALTIPGFTYDEGNENGKTQGVIAADGSLVLKLYYLRNAYPLSLDENTHGSISVTSPANPDKIDGTYYYEREITFAATPKDGYLFAKWNDEDTSNPRTITMPVNGASYKANWSAKTYIVTFIPNGGDAMMPNTQNVVYDSTYGTLPVPNRTGYTFKGWYTQEIGGNEVTAETIVTTAGNHNLYAHWLDDETPYTVEYYTQNLDDLDNYTKYDEETFTGTAETTVDAETKAITIQGFSYDDSKSTGTKSGTITEDGNLVLKLYYTRNLYSLGVTGGEHGMVEITTYQDAELNKYYYGREVEISAKPSAGYSFDKWNDGNTSIERTIIVGDGATYYPIYKANTNTGYTVEHYLQNLNDNEYTIASLGGTVSHTGTTDETAVAESKTFDGFTYDDSNVNEEKTGTIAGDGSLVLKLYYSRDKHTVTVNGGDHGTASITTAADEAPNKFYYERSVTFGATPSAGYSFDKWNDGDTNNPRTVTIGKNNLEYTAIYKPNNYTVTFNKNNGDTVETESKSVTYGEAYGSLPVATRIGYSFVGWYTDPTNGTKVENTTTVISTENHTLYAHWTANTDTGYKIETYLQNLDDGNYPELASSTENKTGTTGETVSVSTLPEITGFTYDTENPNKVTSGTIAGDGSLVLKLYYTRNSYTVSFDVNGGNALSTPDSTKTVKYGGKYGTLPETTRAGYEFAGWYTEDIAGTKISSNTTVDSTADQTLYAHWTANTDTDYKVEYYLMNLDGVSYSLAENGIYTIKGTTDSEVTAEQKTFTGFTYDSGKSNSTGTVKADGSLELKMYYTRNKYKLVLEDDGHGKVDLIEGTVYDDPINEEFYYGQIISFDANPNTGYNFGVWSINGTEDDSAYKNEGSRTITMPAEDTTYTASFEASSNTIYRVRHLMQKLDGTYDLYDTSTHTDEYEGVVGTLATVTDEDEGKTYPGFSYDSSNPNNVKEGNINGESILELKLYHSRNLHSLKLESDEDEGTIICTTAYDDTENNKYYYGRLVNFEAVPKAGYTFDRWQVNGVDDESSYKNEPNRNIQMGDEDVTYKALWKTTQYSVILNVNGGNQLANNVWHVTYGSSYGDMPSPTIDPSTNLVFEGWYTAATGGTKIEATTKVEITNTQTLYAHWEQGNYISFHSNGGEGNMDPQGVLEGNEESLEKNTFEFSGEEDNIVGQPIGGRVFYVNKDAINGYTYKFYDENGEELTTQTVEGLASAKRYSITGVKEGFAGWNTKADGSGTSYDDLAKISITSNIDLYAQWTYEDKFYVVATDSTNNQAIVKRCIQWGAYNTVVGITDTGIGDGEPNTIKALTIQQSFQDDAEGNCYTGTNTIWTWIKEQRDNKLNENDDWFIPTTSELKLLHDSGVEKNNINNIGKGSYYSAFVWTSEELSDEYATVTYWPTLESDWADKFFDQFTIVSPYNSSAFCCLAFRTF